MTDDDKCSFVVRWTHTDDKSNFENCPKNGLLEEGKGGGSEWRVGGKSGKYRQEHFMKAKL